jgi:hypothetical protein
MCYEDFKFTVCIVAKTLANLILELCSVIFEELKEEYMKVSYSPSSRPNSAYTSRPTYLLMLSLKNFFIESSCSYFKGVQYTFYDICWIQYS